MHPHDGVRAIGARDVAVGQSPAQKQLAGIDEALQRRQLPGIASLMQADDGDPAALAPAAFGR